MLRSSRVLSLQYLLLSMKSPFFWLILMSFFFYSVIVVSDSKALVIRNELQVSFFEFMLITLDNYLFITFGIIISYLLMVMSIIREYGYEPNNFYRLPSRVSLWIARCLTVFYLSLIILSVLFIVLFIIGFPQFGLHLDWSSITNESNYLPIHFMEHFNGLELLVLQGIILFFSLLLIGLVYICICVAIESRVALMLIVFVYIFSWALFRGIGLDKILVFTIHEHIMLFSNFHVNGQRISLYQSIFLVFIGLIFLFVVGIFLTQKKNLGEGDSVEK